MQVLNYLRRWRNIRRLRKRLAGGEPLDHHADYRAAHRRYALTTYWQLPLLLLMAAFLIMQTAHEYRDDAHPLPEGATDFPAVRLEEFYDGTLGEGGGSGELYHEWTPMGAVVDEIQEKANDAQTNSILELNTVCYRLPFAWMADLAFDALTEEEWHYGLSEVHWVGGTAPVDTDMVDEACLQTTSGQQTGDLINCIIHCQNIASMK